MGAGFGTLFKLQKKNLLDEGIQAIDEGNLNNSFEKSKVIHKRNDDSVDTPMETESERMSTDNHLQTEYR